MLPERTPSAVQPERTRRARCAVAALVLALSPVLTTACADDTPRARPVLSRGDAAAVADHEYVIPMGTGDRVAAGEVVSVLPARIDAKVGQAIRLVNQDKWGFAAGPFYVGANETLTQTFVSEGEYEGACTLHPSGKLVVKVTD
jgi:plastocyanin